MEVFLPLETSMTTDDTVCLDLINIMLNDNFFIIKNSINSPTEKINGNHLKPRVSKGIK
jgi:hypothetical protein